MSKEEENEYAEEAGLIDWFDKPENSAKVVKVFKKFILITVIILTLFLLMNLLIFVPAINKAKQSKLYPEARVYMSCANEINELYIYPLSSSFGWDSPITKPFYLIRNKLYNTGYSKFPKNEGEKEMWWFGIKFDEFDKLVKNNLCDWGQNVITPKRLVNKKDKFIDWDNELYNHLDLLAQAKITDTAFGRAQIEAFNHVAYIYGYTHNILYSRIEEIENPVYAGLRKKIAIRPPVSTIAKYDHIFNIHNQLLSESEKNKTIAYDYYVHKPFIWLISEVFVYNTAQNILLIKFYHNELKSNDPYVKVFTESHKKLRDYYFKNQYGIPQGIRNNVGFAALNVWPLIAYKCKDNPYMKDYIQYILDKQTDKSLKSIEDIKKQVVQEYKRYDKDRFEQINSLGIN